VIFWAWALGGLAPDEAASEVPPPSTMPWTTTPAFPEGDDGPSPPQADAKTTAATGIHARRTRRNMAASSFTENPTRRVGGGVCGASLV
jgi:hypothetical protein